ncbi:MAG: preprotein translocase subunit SecG [Alphaproteobacteria bacterium CG1_02_46_17]|nr:MAG: preprotein translocase subunit SecG [Alphaproteobacteria bacterium CG1_02_46_17]
MEHVVLVIHLILTLALIILILLQRSEGGGLGLGTGGGLGNFASAQSTANVLTRATTFVAIGFFSTSLILAILASQNGSSTSILDAVADNPAAVTMTAPTSDVPEVPVDGANPTGKVEGAKPESSEPPTVPIAK